MNRRHQSKPIRDAAATVREETTASGSVLLNVPMSGLGWQNLDSVCKRLEIAPEDWLQGALHNLAHRAQKMREAHEMSVRNASRRKR